VALIAERLGASAVRAWAPRGTEPLVALGCVAAGERAWRDGGPVPWLGFVDDAVGANDPTAMPFRIARLRVDPRWTEDELLRRLDVAVAGPGIAGSGAPADEIAAAWVPGDGAISVSAGSIRLEGRPRAEIWIPSARWADDWVLDALLRPGSGEFWIVQRGGVPGREWRFGGENGTLYVEDLMQGRPPQVLARAESSGLAARAHRVRVVMRGAGVSVTWDDKPLTSAPIALPERWRGSVGLVTYRADGVASLTVDGLRLFSHPYTLRVVSASPTADEVAELAHDATVIAALSPPWTTIDGDVVREAPLDRDLFRILARRYAWEIVPTVTVRGGAPTDGAVTEWLAALPERLSREGYAGIRLDAGEAHRGGSAQWEETARDLSTALRRVGKRLVVAAP
jgi:hypothetical protein